MPTLKNNKESSIWLLAIPMSLKAPANPNPCNRPKLNAISQGVLNCLSDSLISKAK